MKKFIFTLFITSIVIFSFAQKGTVLIDEDFSSGVPPTDWTIDANSGNWGSNNGATAGGTAPEVKFHWSPEFNGDSRLISPEIDLTGSTSVILSFKHSVDHYGAGYSVGVATRSGGGSWNTVWSMSGANVTEVVDVLISNADVGASDFQMCLFFSGNSYQINDWYIDDLILILPDNNDVLTASINTSPYTAAGDIDIECTIQNAGLTDMNSVDISYQIDDGDVVTENLTGLNITTAETYNYTFTTVWSASSGQQELKVWVSNLNGNGDDDDTSNDLISQTENIATQTVANFPLFEEFTSSTCGPCAGFNSGTFTPFLTSHEGECAVIKYQMSWPSPGDPYYTEEGGARRVYYGVNAVPYLVTGGVATSTNSSGVNNAFNTQIAKAAFFEINATHQINGDNIDVQIDILPYLSAENFTVHTVVVENQTTGNVGNNGETEFHYVMMKMLPGAGGTTTNFVSDEHLFINESTDMSSTNVEEMDDLSVVVFIQNDITKEIFQSAWSLAGSTTPQGSSNIQNGQTGVNVDTDILITFNQAMRFVDDSEITNENISDFVNLATITK